MTNKNKRQAVSLMYGQPWHRGLIIKPGTGLVETMKLHNIEYCVHEDNGHKEFYAQLSKEEELLLTLSVGGIIWIPYGTFVYDHSK